MNQDKYVFWRFPQSRKSFKGKLEIDENNEGTLVLSGDISLELEYEAYVKSLGEKRSDDYIYLWGSSNSLLSSDIITVEGFESSRSFGFGDCAEINIVIRNFLIDHHISSFAQSRFNNVTVEYSNLDKWLNVQNIDRGDFNGFFTYGWRENKYSVDYTVRKKITIHLDDDLIEIYNFPSFQPNPAINIEHTFKPYVKFVSENKDFWYFMERVNQFKDFLNFVITGHDVHILNIYGSLLYKHGKHTLMKKVTLGYQYPFKQKFIKSKVLTPFLMYNLSEGDLNILVAKWYELRERYLSAYDLFFGTMYNSYLYLQNQYLMLFSALEIYTDIRVKEDEKKELESKIKRVNDMVGKLQKLNNDCMLEKGDFDWLKSILEGKKSFSEKERLNFIYKKYKENLLLFSNNIGEANKFSKSLKEIRNLLIHGHIDYNDLDIDKIFWDSKDIQLILYLCFLTDLGFSWDQKSMLFARDKSSINC